MTATVAYFLQTHRDPEQICRLLWRLRQGSPGAPIVVRHDFTACDLDPAPLKKLDVHLMRTPGPLVRGTYAGQCQPYLDAVEWLEREGIAYEWLASLSAQDYPVLPVPAAEAFLAASPRDGFISYWDVRSPESPWSRRKARVRYWYRYWRLSPDLEPWFRALRRVTRFLPIHVYIEYGSVFGVRALRTPFHQGFRCYGGYTWHTLRRRAALYLRDFLADHPEVVRHYQGVVAPEESLVQTVLLNSGRFDLVNDSLRYIDYRNAVRGTPRTLTVADLPELASGRYHFARKFDLRVDREVLDRIDRELLGVDPAETFPGKVISPLES
jgi:hypothetical protein